MAFNNNQLFDAGVNGFIGGALQSGITDPAPTFYSDVTDSAVAFATQLDSKIPPDANIVTPVDSETLAKVNLLTSLCLGVNSGRFPQSDTPGDYDQTATAIAAAYTEAVAELVFP